MTKLGRSPAFGLALVALITAGATLAAGSTFLKVDIPTLKKMSESVVHAKVVDMRSEWNGDGSMIFTYVTLEVKGRLHGKAPNELVVRVPGGTVDGFASEMEAAWVFQEGGEVVAFIGLWDDGVAMVAGYEQGLSKVNRDSVGNMVLKGGRADGMPISELAKQLGRSGQ